jgi:hypothetical protein
MHWSSRALIVVRKKYISTQLPCYSQTPADRRFMTEVTFGSGLNLHPISARSTTLFEFERLLDSWSLMALIFNSRPLPDMRAKPLGRKTTFDRALASDCEVLENEFLFMAKTLPANADSLGK